MKSFDLTDLSLFLLLLAVYVYLLATLKNLNALHKSYLFFHSSMMLWALANFLVHVTQNVDLQWFFVLTGFYALSLLSFGWLMFSLALIRQFQGFDKTPTWLLAFPALINIVLATTNPRHFLFARPVDGQWVVRTYGPFYWVFIFSSLAYIFVSIGLMIKALKRTAEKELRRQLQLCLTGIVLATLLSLADLLINVVFYPLFGLIPGLISVGIFLSAICFVVAIQRYDLFNIISMARHEVLNSMATAMIVLDRENIVLDMNHTAASYMKVRPGEAFVANGLLEGGHAVGSENTVRVEKEVTVPGAGRINLSINLSPVMGKRNRLLGRVVTLNDVTHLRHLVKEVKEKNRILSQQNAELLQVQEELHQANKKLSEMAITDDLTGCYNRRFLFDRLTKEINAAAGFAHSFTLMILDLDEFKAINDTYGHLAGDDVLRQVAGLVRENLRQSDLMSRFGGEEFVVYSPVCDKSNGLMLAGRIKDVVEKHRFESGGHCLHVTVSIGLVCYAGGGGEFAAGLLDLLLKRADGALYRAKDLGRNRIVVAD